MRALAAAVKSFQAVAVSLAVLLGAAAGISLCYRLALQELANLLRAQATSLVRQRFTVPDQQEAGVEDAESEEYIEIYEYEYENSASEDPNPWIGRERQKGLWHNRNSRLWGKWLEQQVQADSVEGSGISPPATQTPEVADGAIYAFLRKSYIAVK